VRKEKKCTVNIETNLLFVLMEMYTSVFLLKLLVNDQKNMNRRIWVKVRLGKKQNPTLKIFKSKKTGGMAWVTEHLPNCLQIPVLQKNECN
jgi:hypothetical protein